VNWDAYNPEYHKQRSALAAKKSNSQHVLQYDFIVIGSGIAGLTYALKVAEHGTVAIITKDAADEGCTQYAQGGVCAVLDPSDSVENHVTDTMVAGAFLNDRRAVEVVCREGPARVLDLVKFGAEFTRNKDGSLHLTREGGHNNRRIVHAADLTGKEIERALVAKAHATKNITFYEHHLAVELVTDDYDGSSHCFGVDVLDQKIMKMTRFIALATMLACGGAGQVYPNTTNPHVSTGDGIAMAYRANAQVANMEFIQFHPTSLYTENTNERTFLISEAVRGEGGILRNHAGERFMSQYDSRMELAPRDIVARSIQDQMRKTGQKHVWLDISHKPADEILSHFPNIAAKCRELGIDITKDPIPVVPAQHYTCGGVKTGLYGETNIQGLFACGEVAMSGLHGANRLASNSLLEGLVFADRAVQPSVAHAEYVMRHCQRNLHYVAASVDFSGVRAAREPSANIAGWVESKRRELKELMWKNCGIVRTRKDLQSALDFITDLAVETRAVYSNYGKNTQLVELYNLVTCAELVVRCALQRKESRGGHYILDYPELAEQECKASVLSKDMFEPAEVFAHVPKVGGGYGAMTVKPVKKGVASREVVVRSVPKDV
jgi:L-aspartate oxidase